MIQSPEKEKEFLIQLQKDLQEDRKNEISQANPVYYGIQDVCQIVTASGYEDSAEYYDTDTGNEITEKKIFQYMEDEHPEWLSELEEIAIEKDSDGSYEIVDYGEFNQFLEEHTNFCLCYMKDVDYIKPDELFLTRKDAQKHLTENRHHYSPQAVTYAMTAWRSPRYEHLMELLRTGIDFEKSTIVLKDIQEKE